MHLFSVNATFFLNINIFGPQKHEKPASKFAKLAQIQPKSQYLFHKNLPPRDFSLMTLSWMIKPWDKILRKWGCVALDSRSKSVKKEPFLAVF